MLIFNMENILFFMVFIFSVGLVFIEICSILHISPSIGYIFSGILVKLFLQKYSIHNFSLINEVAISFLMFTIGMKLSKQDFFLIRNYTFFSLIQVFGSTLLLIPLMKYFFPTLGNEFIFIISAAFALSSTALCVQLINEKKQNNSLSASATMSTLLIQDFFAIILLIAIQSLVVLYKSNMHIININSFMPILFSYGQSVLLVLGIIFLLTPLVTKVLKLVSLSKSSESIILFTLIIVIGSSLITRYLDLSTELGPFVGGLIIAGSKYKELIMNEIQNPTKVLLGIFFVSVGLSVEFNFILENLYKILGMFFATVLIKGLIVVFSMYLFKKNLKESLKTGALLSGLGEFTFVVVHSIPDVFLGIYEKKLLIVVTTLSMLWTAIVYGVLCSRSVIINDLEENVIIVGLTQKTKVIAEFLNHLKINYVLVEKDPARMASALKDGLNATFGSGDNIRFMKGLVEKKSCKTIVLGFEAYLSRVELIKRISSISPKVKVICFVSDERVIEQLKLPNVEVLIFNKTEQGIKIINQVLENLGWSIQDVDFATEEFFNTPKE